MRKVQGLIIFFALWYGLSFAAGPSLVPFPHKVIIQFTSMILEGELLLHSLASTLRLLAGLGVAVLTGVPLGIFVGLNKKADQIISPVLYILFPIPKIALVPVFMVLLGLGNVSKIALLYTVLFFQQVLSARDGIHSISKELLYAADNLKMGRFSRLKNLYLPSLIDSLFNASRISIGIGIAVLFFAENYAATYGLGYEIMNSWIMVDYPRMYAGIMAISLTAAALLGLLDLLYKRLSRWK